jgi:tetrahydromethanopterin S-methyltransferase subunit G
MLNSLEKIENTVFYDLYSEREEIKSQLDELENEINNQLGELNYRT